MCYHMSAAQQASCLMCTAIGPQQLAGCWQACNSPARRMHYIYLCMYVLPGFCRVCTAYVACCMDSSIYICNAGWCLMLHVLLARWLCQPTKPRQKFYDDLQSLLWPAGVTESWSVDNWQCSGAMVLGSTLAGCIFSSTACIIAYDPFCVVLVAPELP
jgi:hypothetical protein